jgi:hypothetical protein
VVGVENVDRAGAGSEMLAGQTQQLGQGVVEIIAARDGGGSSREAAVRQARVLPFSVDVEPSRLYGPLRLARYPSPNILGP